MNNPNRISIYMLRIRSAYIASRNFIYKGRIAFSYIQSFRDRKIDASIKFATAAFENFVTKIYLRIEVERDEVKEQIAIAKEKAEVLKCDISVKWASVSVKTALCRLEIR